ncbi:RraA family protein [Paracoccus sp. M683]|uniref:RraA family protein n=1 Tax=Paracoccus sp. M683 TaxID=2594268 RepID=UPI00117FC225|nr:RraA family protein [Paracoccus sp. M683]TRW95702.1 RraA family protein [Paracoccus sp. M683]
MTAAAPLPQALLAQASKLGTSTVYEASGIACSIDPGIRPVWQGATVAASAYRLACAPQDNLALHLALEKAPAGSVLVVEAGGFPAGYWGEVLTVAAAQRGIMGLVINGSVRDNGALRDRGFPVFARGVSMRGTGKARVPALGRPMIFCDVPVAAGDLVMGDEDGVLILPAGTVADVIGKAHARFEKELEMIEMPRTGATTVDLLGLAARRDKI